MNRSHIPLVELAASPKGLVIAPMSASFSYTEEANTVSDAHRHDYHSLFYLETGRLDFEIDSKPIHMTSGALLILHPEQVHQSVHSADISGWVMSFDGTLLDPQVCAVMESVTTQIALLNPENNDLNFIRQMLALIFETASDNDPGNFNLQLLHSLTNGLFYKIAELYQLVRRGVGAMENSRPVQLTASFKSLVKVHFLTFKKPSDYAAMLHLSVSYLNDTVKALTGFPATYFIQQQIIAEARRQLCYTSKSIKEIAFSLGYEDHKYFIRLFTRLAGSSPLTFRKNKQTSPHKEISAHTELATHEK